MRLDTVQRGVATAVLMLAAIGSQCCRSEPRDQFWPIPQQIEASGSETLISTQWTWTFNTPTAAVQSRVTSAWQRYSQDGLLFPKGNVSTGAPIVAIATIQDEDPFVHPDIREGYSWFFNGTHVVLEAESYVSFGFALESISQAVQWRRVWNNNDTASRVEYLINASSVRIKDWPRFPHRGIMIDTARHYLPIEFISKILDSMSYHRFNVLHWHITDLQSFPLILESYPNLSKAAYYPQLTYSKESVAMLIEKAAGLGIRIIPEIDTPGHATSWQLAFPELILADCMSLDPTNAKTYEVVETVLNEVMDLFPDPVFHAGGDEVDLACWNRSHQVQTWLRENGYQPNSSDPIGLHMLAGVYVSKVHDFIRAKGKDPMLWQEAFDHYGPSSYNPTPPQGALSNRTIAELWLLPPWNWANLSDFVSGLGYNGLDPWPHPFRAVVTMGWYLSDTGNVNQGWSPSYLVEPLTNATDSSGDGNWSCRCPEGNWRDGHCHCYNITDPELIERVLGGEGCVWGENIDPSNWFVRVYPRACSVAERLWSSAVERNSTWAESRLGIHVCRLQDRGVPFTPLAPGACPV